MKKFWLMAAFLVSVSAVLTAGSGVVSANTLNVRIRPETNSDTVTKLNRGDKVEVIKVDGDWMEIKAPADARVYIYAELFADGKNIKDANLRSGPGTNHQSYGIIPAGTELKKLEEPKSGWIKIAPIATMSCFVSSKYVVLDESSSGANPENPVSEVKNPDAVSAELIRFRESYVAGSQKKVEAVGSVIPCKVKEGSIFKYAVKASDGTVYYLIGEVPENFSRKKVAFKGVSNQIDNWKNPVLEIETIKLTK